MPERPFTLRFWDDSELPATSGNGDGPTFSVRSPAAVAHMLRAPGQLGLDAPTLPGSWRWMT